jgi:glycosyltransferase involved in cell wall biosynthesis
MRNEEDYMKIGINAALLGTGGGYRQTGISRYIGELVDGLHDVIGSEDSVILLGQRPRKITDSPPLRIPWEQTGLAASALAKRLDVFHGPVNVVPLLSPVPSVVTVHDLAFLRYPDQLPAKRRAWLVAASRLSAHKARRVITISQRTADDLRDWLKLPADRVTVIPLAPSPRIQPVTGRSLDVFRMKWDIDRPYILTVGTLEPRKNLPTLLRAFAKIKDDIPHQLVLVGPEGWLTGDLRQTISELHLGDRLRMTGFVSDEELGGWYSAADLFAFPSHYEGFGLPSVEAMRCGVPVLASNSSCFPEVIGDAGVLIPPDDTGLWAETMKSLLADPAPLADLRVKGYARAATFTWTRTAAETYAVYTDVAR